MAYSDDYLRQLSRRTAKNGGTDVEMVRSLFFQFIADLPEELRWDIFSLIFGEPQPDDVFKRAEYLSVVIDLFEGEYEEDNLALSDDELKAISEGVNDFALDLSDEMLMNVMKAAVSRKLLG